MECVFKAKCEQNISPELLPVDQYLIALLSSLEVSYTVQDSKHLCCVDKTNMSAVFIQNV